MKTFEECIALAVAQKIRSCDRMSNGDLVDEIGRKFHLYERFLENYKNDKYVANFLTYCVRNKYKKVTESKFLKDYLYNFVFSHYENEGYTLEHIIKTFCRNGYSNRDISVLLCEYLNATEKIDWVSVGRSIFLEPLQERECFPYYIYQRYSDFSLIYKNWIKKDKGALSKLKELTKERTYEERGIVAFIEGISGKITSQEARRYRSECQHVSLLAVKGLIESRHLYKNFNKIISKFGDSLHWNVVNYMENNLPKENLNVLLGNSLANTDLLRDRLSE